MTYSDLVCEVQMHEITGKRIQELEMEGGRMKSDDEWREQHDGTTEGSLSLMYVTVALVTGDCALSPTVFSLKKCREILHFRGYKFDVKSSG